MKTITICLLLSFLFCTNAKAQFFCGECGMEYTADTVVVHDTVRVPTYISNLDNITQHFGMSFDEFAKAFLLGKHEKDTVKKYSSEMIYLNYFLPLLQSEPDFPNKRMVSNIFTFNIDKSLVKEILPVSDLEVIQNYDVVFKCGTGLNIDYFLTSPQLVNTALAELFRYIDQLNSSGSRAKIKGVNFDFSEFQFKEKRAMAQFSKSVSLIIDSIRLKTIQGMSLYFSFDKTLGERNKYYLYAVSGMVDSVFLLDNSSLTVVTKAEATDIPLYAKIRNQFYLARFSLSAFPITDDSAFSATDIETLAHADYTDNNWEIYLFILLAMIAIALIAFALYWFIPSISYYLNKNQDYLFVTILMIVFEAVILLFGMIAAMSQENILDFSGAKRYILLFLPLSLILIIPLLKTIGNSREKP